MLSLSRQLSLHQTDRTNPSNLSHPPSPSFYLLIALLTAFSGTARIYELHPQTAQANEKFETLANSLTPGDELILHPGVYSQNGRRAVTAQGTPSQPIVIRAANEDRPLLTRPANNIDRHNNIEFIDCAHLVVRGLRFQGGSSGVRFIRGHHVTFEQCDIYETGNNALTMNSGNCHSFIIRSNHIHHTGLSRKGHPEGEGMYIGCHSGSCRTTDSLIEGNYIHHTRSTSNGGNDGIEIKFGSSGNTVRNNVIHDTNIGHQYPGIFVYGGGPKVNIVEGNVIWRAGEGIQVVSDAIVRNNIIIDCSYSGITAAPHGAVPSMKNVTIVNNTIINSPRGIRIRWDKAVNMTFCNNALYCPNAIAIDASGIASANLKANYVTGQLSGCSIDHSRLFPGGPVTAAFNNPKANDFWPKPDSPLINNAAPEHTPKQDFNHSKRTPQFDVGAYETDGRPSNPGWPLQPGFKN